ncbi:stage II sporulation protein M [Keratinibaculum paraultunense]|uniref:Stage II sporulation protein M n=1 Tax=Keratinibaculum paraultunense TaxID=1278232 RepID=A0A4V2UUL1_9FIRM|nr:stage II sporulation protein M [Keratinibaculum paraultunense]QQY80631.1 stage II sporulation protein M [Keratinibaculum paraultunense]TCS91364.1 stage II sporulation protein M [Keratinibaculum paraultunense]
MIYKIKRWLHKQFQENFIICFIVIVIFGIGIISGAITIKVLNLEQKNSIMTFLNTFFKMIGNSSFDNVSILKQSLIDNVKTIILIYITGFIVIGIPIISMVVLFRGFALGFTVGFLVNEYGFKGFIFSILGILPQNLIIIPVLLAISSIGIVFSMKSIKNRKFRCTNNNVNLSVTNYSILVLCFSIIVIGGCFVEAYISSNFLRLIWDYFN